MSTQKTRQLEDREKKTRACRSDISCAKKKQLLAEVLDVIRSAKGEYSLKFISYSAAAKDVTTENSLLRLYYAQYIE